MRLLPGIFLSLLTSSIAFAQTGLWLSRGPLLFDKFAPAQGIALADTSDQLFLGNQSLPAPFNNVRSFYGGIIHFLDQDQAAGFFFNGVQNGELISEFKIHGAYRNSIELNNSVTLTMGANIGLVTNRLQGTSVVPGASSSNWDLNVSLKIQAARWSSALALNHLNEPVVIPMSQVISYVRYVAWHNAIKAYETQQTTFWINHRLFFRDNELLNTLMLSCTIKSLVDIAIQSSLEDVGVSLGLINLPVIGRQGHFYAAYGWSFNNATNSAFTPFQLHLKVTRNKI